MGAIIDGPARPRSAMRGFTLLEVLLVVVLLGILTSITLPSYQHVMRRVHRAAVQAQMLDIANREQQYLLARRSYAATLADLGYALPDEVALRYACLIAVEDDGVPAYEISCTPRATQRAPGFTTLTLNESGMKMPASEW